MRKQSNLIIWMQEDGAKNKTPSNEGQEETMSENNVVQFPHQDKKVVPLMVRPDQSRHEIPLRYDETPLPVRDATSPNDEWEELILPS